MSRIIISDNLIHSSIKKAIDDNYKSTIEEIKEQASQSKILIVGMSQNPFCIFSRRRLDREGMTYKYLEYGSYFRKWKQRLAIKMWSGWPTFPMVFIDGVLIGGDNELKTLLPYINK